MTKKPLKPWKGIVKVQKSLAGPESVLIYNESRSLTVQFMRYETDEAAWRQVTAPFADAEWPKLYMEAERHADGTLSLGQRVPDQPW